MAHGFFAASLLFLLYLLKTKPIGKGPAWRFFKLSLLFFLLWNLWTLTAHWVTTQLPPGALSTSGTIWQHRLTHKMSGWYWIYYLSRFDHLICLPAIWFLLKSLKTFCAEIDQENESGGESHG
jgi:hypothetical protein